MVTGVFLRHVFKMLAVVAAFVLVFAALQRLLMPKYASAIPEGGMIREYYSGTMYHDVIFLGDCEVYTNFSTIALWEEFGITSYIRGSPQQLVWQSYYILEDTLRRETPKVVIFNVLAMQYNEPQSEAYNRLTLDGMRLSSSKINAISASRTEDEGLLSYLLPFFRYKGRWRELSTEDFRFFLRSPRVSINGFIVRSDVMQAGFIPDPLRRANYRFGEKAYYYLERMVQITRESGSDLILVKAPSLYPHWHEEWDSQMVDFAEQNDLLYINFLEHKEDIGLDFSTDTFNAGVSLNVFGAERLARFIGDILHEQFGLPDHRSNAETAEYWDGLAALYHRTIARQQDEISQTGRIQTFLVE